MRARPRSEAIVPTALYRFFDTDDQLLYVGISSNPSIRFRDHGRSKDWWSEVASITLEHWPSRQAALDAEKQAIISERPRWNAAHNGRFQRTTQEAVCRKAVGGCLRCGRRPQDAIDRLAFQDPKRNMSFAVCRNCWVDCCFLGIFDFDDARVYNPQSGKKPPQWASGVWK